MALCAGDGGQEEWSGGEVEEWSSGLVEWWSAGKDSVPRL